MSFNKDSIEDFDDVTIRFNKALELLVRAFQVPPGQRRAPDSVERWVASFL